MAAGDEPLSRDQLHLALEALYDNVQLAESELVRRFPQLATIGRLEERADRARALLLEAIEVLRPARAVPFGSLESRSYDLLSLRYVENLPLPQVMTELSLSRRQAYRDLADAEERLARVLDSWAGAPAEARDQPRRDLISEELASLPQASGEVDLMAAVWEAGSLVQGLAERLGVKLDLPEPGSWACPPVVADRAMLKQVLVQLLSAILQSRPQGPIDVQFSEDSDGCAVAFTFRPAPDALRWDMLDTARVMAASQRLAYRAHEWSDGTLVLSLSAPCGNVATVLVIEDNPGAVELYRRFLAPSRYRVITAPSPLLAFEVARGTQPDAVILDILMPGLDGWSIIKTLREQPATTDIPLIVCSVLEDPSLASSLGADAYLSKPVTRAQLLQALRRCLRTAPPAPDE